MKKPKTLILKRKANSSIGNQTFLSDQAPNKICTHKVAKTSRLSSEDSTPSVLKPFLHKDQTSRTYLYLGKKVKILLGDL
jgi:hypothetical protein